MIYRRGTALALSAVLVLGAVASARAETGGKPVEFHLYKASALASMPVYNPSGEDLGKITDLVMNREGRLIYAALSHGGVAGVGSKYFAIPWDALALHKKDKTLYFVLNAEKSRFENARGFSTNDWPTEPDRTFSAPQKKDEGKVEEAARKTKEAAEEAADTAKRAVKGSGRDQIFRTSALTGIKVKNESGQDLGKVSDMVFNTKQGKIAYAVLSYGGVAGIGAKQFAVGWDCFKLESANLKPDERVLICNIDQATLENNPGFSEDSWPHEPDPRFSKKEAKPSK